MAITEADITPKTEAEAQLIRSAADYVMRGRVPSGADLRRGGTVFSRAYEYFKREEGRQLAASAYVARISRGESDIAAEIAARQRGETVTTTQPGTAYKNIFTGEVISSAVKPGSQWQEVVQVQQTPFGTISKTQLEVNTQAQMAMSRIQEQPRILSSVAAAAPLSISQVTPTSTEQRIEAWKAGYGTEESRPATIEEQRKAGFQAGYEYAGYITPTPTGRGTIMERVSEVRQMPIGNIARVELGILEGNIKSIQEQTTNQIFNEIYPKYQSIINKKQVELQSKVNDGEISVEDANKQLEELNKDLNDKLNEEIQDNTEKRLNQNPNYQKSIRRYIEAAKKYGVTKDVYGKEILSGLQKTKIEIERQAIVDTAESGAVLIPQSAPYFLAKAAAAGQKSPVIIESKEKGVPLYPQTELTAEEKKYMVYGVLAGAGGAYSQFRAATAELKVVNAQQIKTAELKRMKQATLKRLGLDKKVVVETGGTIQEQQIIKQQLIESGAFSDKPEIINLINKAEIGIAKRLNIKTGKIETRYIVRGSMAKTGAEQAGKEYLLTFKITKGGEIAVPRIAITDLKTGQTLVTRPAMPSELKITKIPVPESGQLPIEVSEIERMKIEQILKKKGVSKLTQKQIDDILLRKIEKKGVAFEIGKKARGTISVEDIFKYPKQETPIIFKEIAPTPRAKMISRETQILKMEGLGARGLTTEKAIIQELEKPVILDFKKIGRNLKWEFSPENIVKIEKELKLSGEGKGLILTKLKEPERFKAFSIVQIQKDIEKGVYKKFNSLTDYIAYSSFELGFRPQQLSQIPKTITIEETPTGLNLFAGLEIIRPKQEKKGIEIPTIQIKRELERVEAKVDVTSGLSISTRQTTKVIQRELDKAEVDLSDILGLSIAPSVKTAQKQQQEQLQKLKQLQKLRLKQTQELATQPTIPTYQTIKRNIPEIPITEFGFGWPINLGKKESEVAKKKKLKAIFKQPKRRPDYAASLAAAAFQIQPLEVTKKQLEELKKTEFSGFETRPVLKLKKGKQTKQGKALKKTIKEVEKTGVIF